MRDDEALVTIAVFGTRFEAGLARGALENAGIRALVELRRSQIRLVPPPAADEGEGS